MSSVSTIAAIATPPGPGLRGVIRVSGPRAAELVQATVRGWSSEQALRRGAFEGRFDDGRGTQPVSVLWMPGPHSYTREDVAEFHLPGSPPLLAAALERLIALGAQPARAGEFTRRAFENGRIDLTRAEGVLALIEAATDAERRAATQLLFGGLAERVQRMRDALVDLRVLCEASLDFDELDTGHVPLAELAALGARALAALDEALAWEQRRARAGALPRIALAGAPNAGKSTLFNRLTGASALVAETPGTTRDALRAVWNVLGFECELVDTAGLSDEFGARSDELDPDRIAQRLARAEHQGADLVLYLARAGEPLPELSALAPHAALLVVRTQIDREPPRESHEPGCDVALSAVSGAGLGQLEALVGRALGLDSSSISAAEVGRELSQRHVEGLRRARACLAEALEALAAGAPLDLVAQALKQASDSLDELDGRTRPDDLLERLFERFCIGK